MASLTYEITLTRILSVISWYHLAFFAVSTALLGMTAGAVFVYGKPGYFEKEKLNITLASASLGFAFVVPISLIMLCVIPFTFYFTVISLFTLILVTLFSAIPFFCAGIVLSGVITKSPLPIGKLYASDLLGASCGCLFVLFFIERIDAPSLILACSIIGTASAFCFFLKDLTRKYVRILIISLAVFTLIVIGNSMTFYGIRPLIVKGEIKPPNTFKLEKWNSFSRVVVYKETIGEPQYWGKSPAAPYKEISKHKMDIDGSAATTLIRFSRAEDIDHLKYDVTNIAYYLRPDNDVCIIGAGAGRDIQSALLFNAKKITGIEINPVFVNLLKHQFRDYAGIADQKNVELVVDEARSYLTKTEDRFGILQMSLIDTWASTGAGAFSLSENTLYTTEAWKTFISILKDDGIFTVSRWYSPDNLGETGRLISLAAASLISMDVKNPSDHIAMVTVDKIATLLVSKAPFSLNDMALLKQTCRDLRFTINIVPGEAPSHPVLNELISVKSFLELNRAVKDKPYNYYPPTDENPYFFNMLRLDNLMVFNLKEGVIHGNIIASLVLAGLIISLFILTVFTVILPLLLKKGRDNSKKNDLSFRIGAFYFSLIGAGFMFLEIALIQKLSILLSHPVYALGILLFSLIASTGAGSLLNDYLPLTKKPWVFLYPLTIVVYIILIQLILPSIWTTLMTASQIIKIGASVAVIIPLGVLLGGFFPTGMKLVKKPGNPETPWYWALNGICGVLCSAIAVFISIYIGISVNFYIALCCYGLLVFCMPALYGKGDNSAQVKSEKN